MNETTQIVIGVLGPFVIIGVLMAIILPLKHRRQWPAGTKEVAKARQLDGQGQVAEALEEMTQAVKLFERRLGPKSPKLARELVYFGNLQARLYQVDAADDSFSRALAIYDSLPNIPPADRAEALYGLYYLRDYQKRPREAHALLVEALQGFDATHGLAGERTEEAYNMLVRIYIADKRFTEFAALIAPLTTRLPAHDPGLVIRYASLYFLYGINLPADSPTDDRGLRHIEYGLMFIEDALLKDAAAAPGNPSGWPPPRGSLIKWSTTTTVTRVGTGFVVNKDTASDFFMQHRRLSEPTQYLIDAYEKSGRMDEEVRKRYQWVVAKMAALEGLDEVAADWSARAFS